MTRIPTIAALERLKHLRDAKDLIDARTLSRSTSTRSRGPPGIHASASRILAKPAPPMLDEEPAKQITALVARGALGASVMETDDIKKTYES